LKAEWAHENYTSKRDSNFLSVQGTHGREKIEAEGNTHRRRYPDERRYGGAGKYFISSKPDSESETFLYQE
jgi:hypothetical protein